MWLDVSAQSWKRDLDALSLREPRRRGLLGMFLLLLLAFLVTAALVPARAERIDRQPVVAAPVQPARSIPRC